MGESLLVLKLMELNDNFRFIGIKIFWNSYFHFSLYIHYIYTHLYRYFFNYSTFNPTSIKSMHKVYAILNAEVAYKKIFRGVLLSWWHIWPLNKIKMFCNISFQGTYTKVSGNFQNYAHTKYCGSFPFIFQIIPLGLRNEVWPFFQRRHTVLDWIVILRLCFSRLLESVSEWRRRSEGILHAQICRSWAWSCDVFVVWQRGFYCWFVRSSFGDESCDALSDVSRVCKRLLNWE